MAANRCKRQSLWQIAPPAIPPHPRTWQIYLQPAVTAGRYRPDDCRGAVEPCVATMGSLIAGIAGQRAKVIAVPFLTRWAAVSLGLPRRFVALTASDKVQNAAQVGAAGPDESPFRSVVVCPAFSSTHPPPRWQGFTNPWKMF